MKSRSKSNHICFLTVTQKKPLLLLRNESSRHWNRIFSYIFSDFKKEMLLVCKLFSQVAHVVCLESKSLSRNVFYSQTAFRSQENRSNAYTFFIFLKIILYKHITSTTKLIWLISVPIYFFNFVSDRSWHFNILSTHTRSLSCCRCL